MKPYLPSHTLSMQLSNEVAIEVEGEAVVKDLEEGTEAVKIKIRLKPRLMTRKMPNGPQPSTLMSPTVSRTYVSIIILTVAELIIVLTLSPAPGRISLQIPGPKLSTKIDLSGNLMKKLKYRKKTK